jgi:type I site-specific restriction-modification system R (restriction) subunit
VSDAVYQCQADRDPKELLFQFKRCMAHFAADDARVKFCTKLDGKKSWFLPFDKGHNDGAGNPPNPDGIMTDYLWKDILTKPKLANIIENYAQVVTEENGDAGRKKEKQIFPRYHQLAVVEKLLADVYKNGVGQRYLIQHSAGSGKSNSIAWLAHQLVGLEANGQNVVDSVIVVTDRVNLDKQIKNTIRQFMQVSNTVAWAEHSADLREAIKTGKKIIITTVHKFPVILNDIGTAHKNRKFAIIIDEAHSSQSGSLSARMNIVLGGDYDPNDDIEDKINKLVEGRKMLTNASYFAFTATPKNKTLEMFGVAVPQADGVVKHVPFHNYSMKQAIQKGFILDVLRFYTPIKEQAFSRYYRTTILSGETDPNKLYDLISTMEAHQVYTRRQVNSFVELYLNGAERDELDPILDVCVNQYKELGENAQIEFKSSAKGFVRTYGFLGAILPYGNPEWEKLSVFMNLLLPKLPSPADEDLSQGILDAIDLDSYRAEAKAQMAIQLENSDAEIDPAPTGGIGGKGDAELDLLSSILNTFNDMFGNIDWKDADNVKRQIEQIPAMVSKDKTYRNAILNADKQEARTESDRAPQAVILSIMSDDMELFKQYNDNPAFKKWLSDMVFNVTYNAEVA